MVHKNLLQGVYLYQKFTDDELEAVGDMGEVRLLQAEEDLFTQGDVATALFVIKSGVVRIHQKSGEGDNIEVAVLGEGSHFGEMAMVDGEQRSATATVVEEAEIVVIEYDGMTKLMGKNSVIAVKLYKAIAHFLCGRLRVTTSDLSYAREKNLRYF